MLPVVHGRGRDTMVTLDPKLRTMALTIARAFCRRLPRNVVAEDLHQAALVGLWDGMMKHPDGSGPQWEYYLRMRIRGEILDELRRQDWAGRRRQGASTPPPKMVHLEDMNEQWCDLLPSNDADPERTCITRLDAAKAWRTPMPPRDRAVMAARYVRERLQHEVANEAGLSEPRISQLESRSLVAMRAHLTGNPAPTVVPAETRQLLRQAQIEQLERRPKRVA